ncbi:AraC-type DNA-binding protein [Acinetobacter marinus]|uniref:AraC-type DNA-binding protein n=1 Tax=Acinetobacter marinus TaxID=281375 RepID=A0A1G6HKS6_9GAMM|nr:AraC family transcriptional regulator [Acinetobacter marinus]SDB94821.1 AraC-type DNA-binding protein [Acinetobacter marinus]
MTVKLIVGYLRLMQRVMHHYALTWDKLSLADDVVYAFQQSLQDEQQYELDVEQYVLIMQAMQMHVERPIGLLMAEQVALPDVGLMGYLASTSIDLEQAFQLFQKYYPLLYKMTNIEDMTVIEDQTCFSIQWHGGFQAWQMFYELNLAILFRYIQLIVQADELHPPTKIVLGFSPQFSLQHYAQFFQSNIDIVANCYAITFLKSTLKIKSTSSDRAMNQMLSIQAQQSIEQNSQNLNAKQFRHKVLSLIEQGLTQDHQSIQDFVASKMYCSERTLQRQLAQHDLHFQTLLDGYRFERAKSALITGIALSDIAQQLGYSDQSAFGRAFKRWSGLSPKQFLKEK